MHHCMLPLFSVLNYLVHYAWCVRWRGLSLALPPLRVVSSLWSCALGVLYVCVCVCLGGCSWIMDWGEEGMRAGLEGTYLPPTPPSNTSDCPPFPHRLVSLLLPSPPKQSPSTHGVRWGWLEIGLSLFLSFCFAIFLFLLLHFHPYLSPPLSAGQGKVVQGRSAETGLQMLEKWDKVIQYLGFLSLN